VTEEIQLPASSHPRKLLHSPAAWWLAALLLVALAVTSVQFAVETADNMSGAKTKDILPRLRNVVTLFWKPGNGQTKGAIPRWLCAVDPLWQGQNIYSKGDVPDGSPVHLHPNMPFVTILLTPLAHLPPLVVAAIVNLLKILLVFASVRMLWEVASHQGQRPALWVLALGVLWGILSVVADIQHGNTNIFVLAAISLHLWLYRRGHEGFAGASLALAICLKMVPALFVLYWLYQRSWRVLGGMVVGLAALAVAIPAVALGPVHAAELTRSWLSNLIIPGLVKNSSYPVHINQSLPAMMNRFFQPQGSAAGNIWWNPDDVPVYPGPEGLAAVVKIPPDQKQWITLASLSPRTVQTLTRLGQFAIVCLMAWAIGLRRLPRDDVRRGLHYGLVVLGMMLLNQRTWDEHAAVLLVATVPLWTAIGFGRIGAAARRAAFALTMAGGVVYWLTRQEPLRIIARLVSKHSKPKDWADLAEAYGGAFYLFLLLLVATAILAIALKRSDPPLAMERHRL
jgi:hypothetical protein